MKENKLRSSFLFTLVFLICGCASTFMAGSQPHTGIPNSSSAVYKILTCQQVSDSTSIDGPKDMTYYLAETETGPVLYELDNEGKGAAITNYWKDEKYQFQLQTKTHQRVHSITLHYLRVS